MATAIIMAKLLVAVFMVAATMAGLLPTAFMVVAIMAVVASKLTWLVARTDRYWGHRVPCWADWGPPVMTVTRVQSNKSNNSLIHHHMETMAARAIMLIPAAAATITTTSLPFYPFTKYVSLRQPRKTCAVHGLWFRRHRPP